MNYDELFKQPAFKAIKPEVLNNFKNLVENIKGKNANESMLHIMNFYNSMPKDTNLSREESNALMQAIVVNLSSEDRKNFLKMIDIINNFV